MFSKSQIRISKNASDKEYANVLEATKNYEQVIIAYHDLSQHSASGYGLLPKQINFIETVSSLSNVLHVWFGNPYALKYFQKAKNIVVSYEENDKTQLATFQKLYQSDLFTGSLPVSVGIYKEGKRYNIYQKHISTI